MSDNLRLLGDAAGGEPLTRKERAMGISMGPTKSLAPDPNKRRIDLGTNNVTVEYREMAAVAQQVQDEFVRKLAAVQQQDEEHMAYVTSKLYLAKKKREDAKARRIAAVQRKLDDIKAARLKRAG